MRNFLEEYSVNEFIEVVHMITFNRLYNNHSDYENVINNKKLLNSDLVDFNTLDKESFLSWSTSLSDAEVIKTIQLGEDFKAFESHNQYLDTVNLFITFFNYDKQFNQDELSLLQECFKEENSLNDDEFLFLGESKINRKSDMRNEIIISILKKIPEVNRQTSNGENQIKLLLRFLHSIDKPIINKDGELEFLGNSGSDYCQYKL